MSDATVAVRYVGDAASLIAAQDAAALSAEDSAVKMKLASDDASSHTSGAFSKMSKNVIGAVDNMFGANLSKGSQKFESEMNKSSSHANGLIGKLQSIGGAATLGVAVAAVGLGVLAVKSGMAYQSITTNIAAWGSISVDQAKKITDAFLKTAGTTIYSATDIGNSYGKVVGQLTAMQGHTLDAGQAMTVMHAAMDLAEGSGESLGAATSSLADVMQAYGVKVDGAKKASDELFSAAKSSGNPLSATAKAMEQVHTQLGALTPPLGQTGALLVDMAEHGMKGSRALRVLGTSMSALLKPGVAAVQSQQQLKQATDALPASLQTLAAQFSAGTLTATQVSTATKGLTGSQADLWKAFTTAQGAVTKNTDAVQKSGITAFDSSGKFVGLKSIIAQTSGSIQGMSDVQALAQLKTEGLTGATANKLLPIIRAGPAAFAASQAAVEKSNAAHDAAAKQAQTTAHQFDVLKVTVQDWITELGQRLIPILTDASKYVAELGTYLMQHKQIVEIVGGIIVGVLVAAITLWVGGMIIAAAQSVITTASVLLFGQTAAMAAGEVEMSNAQTAASAIRTTAIFVGQMAIRIAQGAVWVAQMIAQGAKWVAEQVVQVASWVVAHLPVLAGYAAQAAAAVASGIAQAIAFAPVLVALAATAAAAVVAAAAMIVPFLPFIAVAAAIGAAIYLIATNFGAVKNFIMGAVTDVVNFVKSHWMLLVDILMGPIGLVLLAWQHFHTDITNVFNTIVHDIMAVFKGVGTWLIDAGKDLIAGLIKGIVEAPLHGIEDVGHHVLSAFKSVLSVFSPSTATEEMGRNLIEGLQKGINEMKVDVSSINKILPAIKQLTDAMGKSFSAGLGPAGLGVDAFTKSVTDGIDKALGPVSSKVKAFGTELVNDITKPLTTATAAVTSFGPKFLAGFQALQQALAIAKTFSPSLVSTIKAALDQIGAVTKAFAPGFVTSFSKIDDALKHVSSFAATMKAGIDAPLNSALAKAGQFGSKVESDIIGKMKDADTAVKAFSSSMDKLADPIIKASAAVQAFAPAVLAGMQALKDADAQVTTFGPDFTANIQGAMTDAVNGIAPIMDTFSQKMKNGMNDLNNADNAMKTFSNDLTSNLISKLHDAVTAAQNFGTAIVNSVVNQLNTAETSLGNFGMVTNSTITSVNNLQTAINTLSVASVVSAFSALPGQIASIFNGLPGQLYTIGQQLVQGLIGGIENQVGPAASAAGTAMQAVVNAAKAAAQAHSPSRVMMGLGQDLMDGLTRGIQAAAASPAAAADANIRALIMQAIQATQEIGNMASGPDASNIGSARLIQMRNNANNQLMQLNLMIDGAQFATAVLPYSQAYYLAKQKTGGQLNIQMV